MCPVSLTSPSPISFRSPQNINECPCDQFTITQCSLLALKCGTSFLSFFLFWIFLGGFFAAETTLTDYVFLAEEVTGQTCWRAFLNMCVALTLCAFMCPFANVYFCGLGVSIKESPLIMEKLWPPSRHLIFPLSHPQTRHFVKDFKVTYTPPLSFPHLGCFVNCFKTLRRWEQSVVLVDRLSGDSILVSKAKWLIVRG